MTRRDALRLLPIAVSFSFPRQNSMPKPFKVAIPQAAINRILARVWDTRLPDGLVGGCQVSQLERVIPTRLPSGKIR